MANIANLITKLSGIIASLDDIRDAISQGGGGSSTASGITVTPVSPLTGTNLQATTNETAALLQDHTDEISALNSSITSQEIPITTSLTPASVTVVPTDNYRTTSYVVRAGICFVNISVDVIAAIGNTSIGVCNLPAGLHSTYKPPSWSTFGASSPNLIAESLLQNGVLYIRNASVGTYTVNFSYPVV